MTFLIIYLSIGVLMNFIGPVAKHMNKKIEEVRNLELYEILTDRPQTPKYKKIIYELYLRAITVLLYPILIILIFIDFLRPKKGL